MKFVAEEFSIPLGFDNWLLNLMAFAVMVGACVHIWRLTRPEPTFEEQLAKFRDHVHATFATKTELIDKFDAREETARQFRTELRTDFAHLDNKLSHRSKEIFDEVRTLIAQISHLEGRLFDKEGRRR